MLAVYGLNLFGVNGKHKFLDRTGILAMSYATMGILVNGMKYTFKEKRPDTNARNSFPSGHTATAFMGAEFPIPRIQRSLTLDWIFWVSDCNCNWLSANI